MKVLFLGSIEMHRLLVKSEHGGLYWIRTSDLIHVKDARYQLRQETNRSLFMTLSQLRVKGDLLSLAVAATQDLGQFESTFLRQVIPPSAPATGP